MCSFYYIFLPLVNPLFQKAQVTVSSYVFSALSFAVFSSAWHKVSVPLRLAKLRCTHVKMRSREESISVFVYIFVLEIKYCALKKCLHFIHS